VSKTVLHVLTLLGLALPRGPVQTALRALHTDLPRLRSLALEYLESAVPRELREPLCKLIEGHHPEHAPATPESSLANLMKEAAAAEARLGDTQPQTPPAG
jgi:hypothetical protein